VHNQKPEGDFDIQLFGGRRELMRETYWLLQDGFEVVVLEYRLQHACLARLKSLEAVTMKE
jgi:hypothetical protein